MSDAELLEGSTDQLFAQFEACYRVDIEYDLD